jgi:hypothetical protein
VTLVPADPTFDAARRKNDPQPAPKEFSIAVVSWRRVVECPWLTGHAVPVGRHFAGIVAAAITERSL